MDVIWLGGSCLRLQAGNVSILTDPFDLPPGTGPLTADIVTLSDRTARGRLQAGGRYRLVDGPGEYEIKGIPITGIATRRQGADAGPLPARNVVYTLLADGVAVCHLGRMNLPPSAQEVQEMGSPDVLIIPVGESTGLPVAQAVALASQLEARLLIPVVLGPAEGTGAVERFCRELGSDPSAREPRLQVSSSTLPATARVVLLEPRAPAAAGAPPQ
jgi:L-ascorbate metabolism protein UlaG (beta-lactamase superfamily)